ncbi:RNA-binding protein 12-like [Cucurbita pepo subsp. pepo]|uniref:RNA-binding protein 12-like n=1 Tax=Cucurbita pepo subsp. pepo TaxID=3664 RepID=UPI000C9D5086|nr:RNA-binding protein 12-like [Cucurbita pepo subsp. pepo]
MAAFKGCFKLLLFVTLSLACINMSFATRGRLLGTPAAPPPVPPLPFPPKSLLPLPKATLPPLPSTPTLPPLPTIQPLPKPPLPPFPSAPTMAKATLPPMPPLPTIPSVPTTPTTVPLPPAFPFSSLPPSKDPLLCNDGGHSLTERDLERAYGVQANKRKSREGNRNTGQE